MRDERVCRFGELILDPGWDLGEHRPNDQAVPFQVSQRQREHALGDARDVSLQLGEPQSPVVQGGDDQQRPFVRDPIQQRADRSPLITADQAHVLVTRHRHLPVRW